MRSRTFVIICCTLLTLAAVGGGYCVERRLSGGQALAEVRAQADCPSAAAALDQLIASGPRLDADAQARFSAWMRARPDRTDDDSRHLDEAWFLAGKREPPEQVQAWLERYKPRMEELRSLLCQGPLCTTTLGALANNREQLLNAEVGKRRVPIPDLRVLRRAYRYFGLTALTATDPTAALDALDALDRSQLHGATLIDSLIAQACSAMRDLTYLRLVLRDRVPATHLRAWLAETSDAREQVVRAVRGERLLNWAYLAELASSSDLPRAGARSMDDLDWWLNGERKIARMGRQHLVAEAVLTGEKPVSALDEFDGDEDQLLFGLNVPGMMIAIVSTDTAHRMARSAASLVATQHDTGGTLPTGNDEALASALPFRSLSAGGAYAPLLRYERVEEGRFRILADTQAGLAPDVREDVAMYLANRPFRFDDRREGPQLRISMWSIELRVR